jgi:hypothetical protein
LAYGFSLCGLADERGADRMPSERKVGQTESAGICAGVLGQRAKSAVILSAAETAQNVIFKFVPSACTVPMIPADRWSLLFSFIFNHMSQFAYIIRVVLLPTDPHT